MTDDSDIKIYTPMAKKAAEENFAYTEEVRKHQLNGNIRRARELGRKIAGMFTCEKSVEDRKAAASGMGVELNENITRQLMVLAVCSAEYCIGRSVALDMLAKEAQSAMYAQMLKTAPGAYDDLLRSASFSFYYMTVGDKSASPDDIASTFALVCGDKNSKLLFSLGKVLYESFMEEYSRAVSEVEFEK